MQKEEVKNWKIVTQQTENFAENSWKIYVYPPPKFLRIQFLQRLVLIMGTQEKCRKNF